MGFFKMPSALKNLVETASDVIEKVKDKVEWDIIYPIKNKIDEIVDGISKKTPYKPTSPTDVVDVDKELTKYKNTLNPSAKKAEDELIQKFVNIFTDFANEITESYPIEAATIRHRQKELESSLQDTITNYVSEHFSLGNPAVKTVLEMEAGEEKRQAVKNCSDKILSEAIAIFNNNLNSDVQALSRELGERLKYDLEQKKQFLTIEMNEYEGLIQQAQADTLDMEKLEGDYLAMNEVYLCLTYILEKPQISSKV